MNNISDTIIPTFDEEFSKAVEEVKTDLAGLKTSIATARRGGFIGPRRDSRKLRPGQPLRMGDIKPKVEMVLVANPAVPTGVMPMTRKQAEQSGLPILTPIR